MAGERPSRVNLSGDREGAYVIVEERPDGSLVIIPDRDARRQATRSAGQDDGGLFGALVRRATPARSTREALEDWGVALLDGESVSEFGMADVNGRQGFVALTSHRLLFLARGARGLELVDEHSLSALTRVEPGRRGRKRWLTVTWDGAETVTIGGPDRDALQRLETQLQSLVPPA
jgi:hypothetical protein